MPREHMRHVSDDDTCVMSRPWNFTPAVVVQNLFVMTFMAILCKK